MWGGGGVAQKISGDVNVCLDLCGWVCPKSSGDVDVCLDLCGGGGFAQTALGMLMSVFIYFGGLPNKLWGC